MSVLHQLALLVVLIVTTIESVRIYDQCGGDGYHGPTECDAGLQCYRRSQWFSSCQTSCPQLPDWECATGYVDESSSEVVAPWEQCGGDGWRGASRCTSGFFCVARTLWYSQCRNDCPAGWTGCVDGQPEPEPTIEDEDEEEDLSDLDEYDPSAYNDDEELETDDFPDPSEVDLDELQQLEGGVVEEEEEVEVIEEEEEEEEEEKEKERRRRSASIFLRAASCKVSGKSGTCIATSSCKGKGTSYPGHCPGAKNIQCCIKKAASSSSSSSGTGLCGSYAGTKVTAIRGNGNVAYKVVKIKQAHLVNSGSYRLSSSQSDNTMTTKTACAFDKMRSAALKKGVSIKIASGFRTVSRQQYFYNCYKSKRCNGGNLAARPGTSNHGRGVALDLNTNCGRQTGAKPNCGGSRIYQWLKTNGHKYGFTRTVKSEPWHWEFRGVGVGRASYT